MTVMCLAFFRPVFLFGNLGVPELIIIVVLILLLFGAKRIPDLMKSMGKGVRSFKEGMNEIGKDLDTDNKDGKYQKDETK